MSGCAHCGSLEPIVAEKDGFRSETSICVWSGRWCLRTRAFLDEAEVAGTFTPINYCPFCGRSMGDVTPPEPCIDYRYDVADGSEMTSEMSGSVARTLLEAWEDMA